MNSTTRTRTRIKLQACILRTVTDHRAMTTACGYTILFTNNPKDSVRIEDTARRSCFFGIHKDDPFLTAGIDEDEAAYALEKLCEKHVGSYQNTKTENMTDRFQFNPAAHKYTLDGKPMPGVTTIVRVLDKPGLLQWAADEALDAISKVKEPTPQDWDAARFAWKTKRDKAGEKGTSAHDIIEGYVREWIGEWNGTVSDEWVAHTDMPDAVRPFVTWARENGIEFLDCEVMQYSESLWYAGRFDLLYNFKGEIWLGDIKTSKGVYPEYFAQLGGYDIMCEERGVKVDHRAVLHLKGDTLQVYPSYAQQRDKDFFLSCLNIYKTLQTF